MSSFEFHENCCRQVRAVRKGVREVLSVFSTHLVLRQNSVQETSTKSHCVFMSFMKPGALKAILYLGAYMNLYPHFPLFSPILVKIGTGYLHVMLLISYEFLQNQRRKDFSFPVGINEKHLSV